MQCFTPKLLSMERWGGQYIIYRFKAVHVRYQKLFTLITAPTEPKLGVIHPYRYLACKNVNAHPGRRKRKENQEQPSTLTSKKSDVTVHITLQHGSPTSWILRFHFVSDQCVIHQSPLSLNCLQWGLRPPLSCTQFEDCDTVHSSGQNE